MLHFSCDLCGQSLKDQRYVAKLEIFPAFDPEAIDESDLEADHLQEIAETLEEMEASGKYDIEDCGAKIFRFDLCTHCQQRYIKDPLGRDALRRMNFSEN